jgi:putative nucleotidyltransferase with HDIG domain
MVKKETISGKRIVASGSYVVGTGNNGILEAYLGTCVGVTLYDPQKKIGGLIHLLLPEPPSPENPWNPEMYAETGLPLMISELEQKGAVKKNLEAVIAGGALVGPLAKRDLILDIGGRTADIVGRILRKEKITIKKAEIGGYFSCRMNLHLGTGETQIEPLGISPKTSGETAFDRSVLKELDSLLKRVQPIPQIALKIIRMISEQKYQMGEITEQIMQDQVLSAKVIGFCNSAYLGGRTLVDSIEKALLIVGEKWLLQMIVKTSIEDLLSQPEGGYSLCKGGLFQHACGTAVLAREMARATREVSPDLAYTAGLLHDIGKVALDQFMNTARPYFYRQMLEGGKDLISAEEEMFGTTHTEVGGQLADRWSLPENLIEVIRTHHQPENAVKEIRLTHIIYLADLVMSRFMVRQELEKQNTEALLPRLKKAGLSPEQFSFVIEKIPLVLSDSPLEGLGA